MDWTKPNYHLGEKPQGFLEHSLRFLTSPHTRDLMVIAAISVGTALIIVAYAGKSGGDHLPVELTVALVGIALGAGGWAYQSANARFGVVDIFAAEIATICRVAAVAEFMPTYIRRYVNNEPVPPVTSKNNYLIVFDNNAKDLEVLDGEVVQFVAQFYLYMKVLQDALARGSDGSQGSNVSGGQNALNTIYNGFLAFESARKAITVLVDDHNKREEYILTTLVSELPAYALLSVEFKEAHDLRSLRIAARFPGYRRMIKKIERAQRCMAEGSPQRDLASRIIGQWHDSVKEGEVRLPANLRRRPSETRDEKRFFWDDRDG